MGLYVFHLVCHEDVRESGGIVPQIFNLSIDDEWPASPPGAKARGIGV
jgi:hypothetical protein